MYALKEGGKKSTTHHFPQLSLRISHRKTDKQKKKGKTHNSDKNSIRILFLLIVAVEALLTLVSIAVRLRRRDYLQLAAALRDRRQST